MAQIPPSISEIINCSNKKELDIEQKIVEELLNDKNLDTKTELEYPMKWSVLNVIADFLEFKQLKIPANTLRNFVNISFKYLISKNREGRKEYIQALQSVKEKQLENNPLSMKVDK